jgi:hypothetical protein
LRAAGFLRFARGFAGIREAGFAAQTQANHTSVRSKPRNPDARRKGERHRKCQPQKRKNMEE